MRVEDSAAQSTGAAVATETGQASAGGLAPATAEPANCLTMRKAVTAVPAGVLADPEAAGGKARRKEFKEPREPREPKAREPKEGPGEDDEGAGRAKKVKVMKQTDVPPQ